MTTVRPGENECTSCGGKGRKYFDSVGQLADYLQSEFIGVHDAVYYIRQYKADGYVDCIKCGGLGYITR